MHPLEGPDRLPLPVVTSRIPWGFTRISEFHAEQNSPFCITYCMKRVYTYRIEGLTAAKHQRLEAFFLHLGWLRNRTVGYCRDSWEKEQRTPSYYDLCKWLTKERQEDRRTSQWNASCQRSILNRVRKGYDKFFRDHKGLPRFKNIDHGAHSFETEAAKPRKHRNGNGHYVQIKGLGRLSFTDTRGALDTAAVKDYADRTGSA